MIQFKKAHGEKQSHNQEAADHWVKNVWPEVFERYSAEDIYNCDETGVSFRALPDSGMVYKHEKPSGSKLAKERITALVTCNYTGSDKRKLFVIGKSEHARCFRGVAKLPVQYKANKNAWMTAVLFKDYLKDFDRDMVRQKRKVCLLMDNCSAHNVDARLTNVEVVFLPPNTTSSVQPLDQGIIKNIKHFYRKSLLQRIVSSIDSGTKETASKIVKSVTLLDAIHMLVDSWRSVKPETISNCFMSGLTEDVGDEFLGFSQEDIPHNIDAEEYESYLNIDEDVETEGALTDSQICEGLKTTADADEEEEDETPALPPPSNAEVICALDVLRRRVQHKGLDSVRILPALRMFS
jgi:hypothetical protein